METRGVIRVKPSQMTLELELLVAHYWADTGLGLAIGGRLMAAEMDTNTIKESS